MERKKSFSIMESFIKREQSSTENTKAEARNISLMGKSFMMESIRIMRNMERELFIIEMEKSSKKEFSKMVSLWKARLSSILRILKL